MVLCHCLKFALILLTTIHSNIEQSLVHAITDKYLAKYGNNEVVNRGEHKEIISKSINEIQNTLMFYAGTTIDSVIAAKTFYRLDNFGLKNVLSGVLEEMTGVQVSQGCKDDMAQIIPSLLVGLGTENKWQQVYHEMPVLTSFGSLRDSIEKVSSHVYGRYSECVGHVTWNKVRHPVHYCVAKVSAMTFGLCLPQTCAAEDVRQLMQIMITATRSLLPNVTTEDQYILNNAWEESFIKPAICEEEVAWKSWTLLKISFVTLLCMILTMILVSICVDWKSASNGEIYSNIVSSRPWIKQGFLNICEVVSCFSVKRNTLHLFRNANTTHHKGVSTKYIRGLDTIRVVCMILILTVHYIGTVAHRYDNLQSLTLSVPFNLCNAIIYCLAGSATNMFFIISGLLSTNQLLKRIEESKQQSPGYFFWPLAIFVRYARMAPVVLFFMMYFVTVHPYMLSTPGTMHFLEQKNMEAAEEACRQNLWIYVMFISTFFGNAKCSTIWYPMTDFHVFIIGILPIIMLNRKPKLGAILVLLGMTISIFYSALYFWYERISSKAGITTPVDGVAPGSYGILGYAGVDKEAISGTMALHHLPQFRVSTYFFGVLTGYYLYCASKEPKTTFPIFKIFNIRKLKMLAIILYTGFSVISYGLVIAFVLYSKLIKQIGNSFTDRLIEFVVSQLSFIQYHLIWQLPAVIIVLQMNVVKFESKSLKDIFLGGSYLCKNGIFSKLANHSFWQPLSRLTFAAYIMNGVVLDYITLDIERKPVLSIPVLVAGTAGSIACTFLAAYLIYLLVEAPSMRLTHLLIKKVLVSRRM